jgi:glycine cleavage system H protein
MEQIMDHSQVALQEFRIGSDSNSIPADRSYDREHHMWARINSTQQQALVGIDALGLAALGDLAYVTLKNIGTTIQRGESFGTLEAAKMTGDLIAPVSGVITAHNAETIRNPSLVNQAPYEDGWLVVIKPTNWNYESAQLVSGDDLPAWIESEMKRYREQGWID